jgi:hypothetical protein
MHANRKILCSTDSPTLIPRRKNIQINSIMLPFNGGTWVTGARKDGRDY